MVGVGRLARHERVLVRTERNSVAAVDGEGDVLGTIWRALDDDDAGVKDGRRAGDIV